MKAGKWILICFAVLTVLLAAGLLTKDYLSAYFIPPVETKTQDVLEKDSSRPEEEKRPTLTQRVNILLVGIDAGEFPSGGVRNEKGRTDTIILAQLDPKNKKIHALSVPRDTLVEIPGRGLDKVNHAYVYGDMELTIGTIENFTGLKIDNYVKVDYKGFACLIDAVGGVEMVLEKDIQSGRYLLKKGRQVLDGEHAYALIRHRKEPMGDIARVERQQQMAKALFEQIHEKQNLLEMTLTAFKLKEHITTDLTVSDMILLINTVKGFSDQDIDIATVPGTFYEWQGLSYWKPEEKETLEILKKFSD